MSERVVGDGDYVLVGGKTLAVPGATGFVAPAQRAVIGMTVSPDRRSRATPGPQLWRCSARCNDHRPTGMDGPNIESPFNK